MVSVPRNVVRHEVLGFKFKKSICLYHFSFIESIISQTTYFDNGPFLGVPELGRFSKKKNSSLSELEF